MLRLMMCRWDFVNPFRGQPEYHNQIGFESDGSTSALKLTRLLISYNIAIAYRMTVAWVNVTKTICE